MAKELDYSLIAKLSMQTPEFQAGVKSAMASMTKMKNHAKSESDVMGGAFKKLGGMMAGVFAIGSITEWGKTSVEAANETAKANRNLLFSVNGNRESYGKLILQANALRDATGIDDEAIKQIQQLGAGAGYSVQRIKDLTSASVELSKKTGMDLQQAYVQLNVTLSGSVGRLKRIDPEFATLTKEQLRNGAAIDLVNSKYGGFAANAAGAADKAKMAYTEFQKAAGGGMKPLTDIMFTLATATLQAVTPTERLSEELEKEATKSKLLMGAILGMNDGTTTKIAGIKQLIALNPEYLGGLNAEKITQNELLGIQRDLNKEFEKKIKLQVNQEKITDIETKAQAIQNKMLVIGQSITEKYLAGRKVKSTGGLSVEAMARTTTGKTSAVAGGIYAQNATDNSQTALFLLQTYQNEQKKLNALQTDYVTLTTEDLILTAQKGDEYNKLIREQTSLRNNLNNLNARGAKNDADKLKIQQTSNQLTIVSNKIASIQAKSGNGIGAGADTPAGINARAKAKADYAKLVLNFNKTIATDEFAKKQAEAALFIETETSNAKSAKLTNNELRDRIALILLIGERMKATIGLMKPKEAELIGPTSVDQFGTKTLTTPAAGKQLKPQDIRALTTEAKTFGETMNTVAGMTNDSLASVGQSLGDLSSMFGEQTTAYKAFASAQAVIATYMAAALIMANTAKLGPVAMVLAMTSTIAMGLMNVAKINGAKFANGGIVPGSSFSGDKVHAMVNSGEMILNKTQQSSMYQALASGGLSGGGTVTFKIEGTTLVGVLANSARKQNRIG